MMVKGLVHIAALFQEKRFVRSPVLRSLDMSTAIASFTCKDMLSVSLSALQNIKLLVAMLDCIVLGCEPHWLKITHP